MACTVKNIFIFPGMRERGDRLVVEGGDKPGIYKRLKDTVLNHIP